MKKLFLALLCATISLSISAQKRVLFIGDSITDGNWGTNCNGERNLGDMNHIFGHGYMFLCASYYMSLYPNEQLQFFNRGISGNTVSDLEKRWQTDALDLEPDILSVLIGINDIICSNGQPVDTLAFEQKLRNLLSQSLQKNPNLKIVLGEPFCEDGFRVDKEGYVRTTCEALARSVRRIATDFDAVFLPYQSMFDDLCSRQSTEYWIWDGVHPTPAGHYRMAEMWKERVRLF